MTSCVKMINLHSTPKVASSNAKAMRILTMSSLNLNLKTRSFLFCNVLKVFASPCYKCAVKVTAIFFCFACACVSALYEKFPQIAKIEKVEWIMIIKQFNNITMGPNKHTFFTFFYAYFLVKSLLCWDWSNGKCLQIYKKTN